MAWNSLFAHTDSFNLTILLPYVTVIFFFLYHKIPSIPLAFKLLEEGNHGMHAKVKGKLVGVSFLLHRVGHGDGTQDARLLLNIPPSLHSHCLADVFFPGGLRSSWGLRTGIISSCLWPCWSLAKGIGSPVVLRSSPHFRLPYCALVMFLPRTLIPFNWEMDLETTVSGQGVFLVPKLSLFIVLCFVLFSE